MGELERRPNAWALTPLVVFLIDLFGVYLSWREISIRCR